MTTHPPLLLLPVGRGLVATLVMHLSHRVAFHLCADGLDRPLVRLEWVRLLDSHPPPGARRGRDQRVVLTLLRLYVNWYA